ncbi:MAG: cytochrome bd-I oxidase subunit CydX [Beijerinckiaceae bacterium]|nr:cytochrome bd-I oxidase subunit CydX [Beijerinckiaceae bacterium]MCI0736435.1 cytochrome bd-I oxidase subunit CydX [Beijerinckiaceae bacterium]
MWYFSWVLGVSFAVSFSIINALWLEEQLANSRAREGESSGGRGADGGLQ